MYDSEQEELDARRGKTAWYMNVSDLQIGHDALGFDYPMNGDDRPCLKK